MRPLKRKQVSTQEEWLVVWNHIRSNPDHARAERLVTEALQRTLQRLKSVKRPAYCWSGGKDSIALWAVLRHVPDLQGTAALTRLEYPAFETWIHANAPDSCTLNVNERIDMDWLKARLDYLFPKKNASRWFNPVQKAEQKRYAKEQGIDLLIGGWRGQDGNYLGTGIHKYEYETGYGTTKFSPIAQWTHEDVLTVIASTGLPLPPIYSWPRGFPAGTGPWPARPRVRSLQHSWAETHFIDPSVLETAAAADLPGARDFLEGER